MSQTTTDLAVVADALRAGDRFLVTSHENPDGDALGSLLAMHLALVELGKDTLVDPGRLHEPVAAVHDTMDDGIGRSVVPATLA